MTRALIGCGQLTWGRSGPSPEEVLREIAQAGYAGAPAPAPDPEQTRKRFSEAGLKPAPGYLGAEFWDPAARDEIVARAREHARNHQQLGLTELYAAANLTPDRRAVSGHVQPSDALTDDGYATFAATLTAMGRATQEFGVATCFHNHVGSFIETRAEMDKLFSLVDRDAVFMGPDFGHLAWAGDDVVALCRDYKDVIKTVHIKDINPDVLKEGVAQGWDYAQFSGHGIFTELGTGFVDLHGALEVLGGADFPGWIIVETDVTQLSSPLESATISRDYLRSIGM